MKKLSTIKYLLVSSVLLIPFVAVAQTNPPAQKNLKWLITQINDYLADVLFLLVAIAVVVFVWQVIRYYIMPNEDRKDAGKYVMWSIIGFFVILSLWGIVAILGNSFGLQNSSNTTQFRDLQNIFPTK